MIECNHMVNTDRVRLDFSEHCSLSVVEQLDTFSARCVVHHPIVHSAKRAELRKWFNSINGTTWWISVAFPACCRKSAAKTAGEVLIKTFSFSTNWWSLRENSFDCKLTCASCESRNRKIEDSIHALTLLWIRIFSRFWYREKAKSLAVFISFRMVCNCFRLNKQILDGENPIRRSYRSNNEKRGWLVVDACLKYSKHLPIIFVLISCSLKVLSISLRSFTRWRSLFIVRLIASLNEGIFEAKYFPSEFYTLN